ncbi:MAG: anaerobic sulfatase maturase [Planctomycetes bacterium]|nr:anaerobic sulfatase maturase [Planctomycetota bacterium]
MTAPAFSQLGLHVLAKPIGPICNLDCAYCFYLRKQSLYPADESWRMSDETLEAYIGQYIAAQPDSVEEIDFAFQGGEPTLMGLDFFARVVELQKQHAPPGRRIHNSLQTNGILLDDAWCEFLGRHNFLVGISIDGPADLHDKYRRDKKGDGTLGRVTAAVQRLSEHRVEFNALTCINRHNADHPLRVYRFLRELGVRFIQFIPIVERCGDVRPRADMPPEAMVSERSVLPGQLGACLIGVFDDWVRNDVGRIFVRDFDQALGAWAGAGASLCVHAKHCGRATAIEHNGDLYSCDHYVDPAHLLGNIHQTPIAELAGSARQEQFGTEKETTLPEVCRRCEVLFACNGLCPKDRFAYTPDGRPGLHFLCPGYKAFFSHIAPHMRAMAAEVQAGRPATGVMHRLRAEQQDKQQAARGEPRSVGRNAPCPCGSGRKFKVCCMRR